MFEKPLFIFELANNHSGSAEHAKRIITALKEISVYDSFDYAVKLQYRDLDTFITEEAKNDPGNSAVQRFLSTRLSADEFKVIRDYIVECGYKAICTPFDESSVDLIEKHDYDFLKIAGCSFTDWPLLERIAKSDKPIIASCAAATLEEIDRVVQFFANRNKTFSLMHCVGEYPTVINNLQLNQLDLLKARYPQVTIGYSTHESPEENFSVALAVAKGARIFEKHVGIPTDTIKLNAYSATPEQAQKWLESAHKAYLACGVAGERHEFSDKEKSDLWNFRRGVFAKTDIPAGSTIGGDMFFCAIPKADGQLLANDMSKYNRYTEIENTAERKPILRNTVSLVNVRELTVSAYEKVKALLSKSGITLGRERTYELSHHYGIERFDEFGCAMVEVINRAYCKKIIIVLPGQTNPAHAHKIKEESFHVLFGTLDITVNGEQKTYKTGEVVHVSPNQKHSISSKDGCVFEEVSTAHIPADSYYDDESIVRNTNRKTVLRYNEE
jgi:sialic acid synthase SpsE/mannose-6-phosphate isomerase-like protein (cupin superfamily)